MTRTAPLIESWTCSVLPEDLPAILIPIPPDDSGNVAASGLFNYEPGGTTPTVSFPLGTPILPFQPPPCDTFHVGTDPANLELFHSITFEVTGYVNGDPINFNDPTGLVTCGDLDVFGGGSVSDYMNAGGDAGRLTRFVWAEGGTLSQNGGSQLAMGYAQMLIAQSIENRLAVANGQVAVQGADGNIYWGNGGTFNGVTVLAASILGYGGHGTTLSQELVRAAAGTGEVNSRGELVDKSGLNDTLDQELGDVSRALAGRVAVSTVGGGVIYVTPECDGAISAMQATNTILGGTSLNSGGFFATSWKANGNSNPDPTRLYNLGSVGGTTFFGVGNYAYGQYAYPPVRRPPIRR
jgi:hypothetical protein